MLEQDTEVLAQRGHVVLPRRKRHRYCTAVSARQCEHEIGERYATRWPLQGHHAIAPEVRVRVLRHVEVAHLEIDVELRLQCEDIERCPAACDPLFQQIAVLPMKTQCEALSVHVDRLLWLERY